MTILPLTAQDVYNPVSNTGAPRGASMQEAQAYHLQIEQIITAVTSNGGLAYTSLASLNADLDHDAGTSAWVIGDSTASNNGIYAKSGASGAGSWTKIADLPYGYIPLANTDSGDENAITANSAIPVPSAANSALLQLNILDKNTGAVTLALNGGATKPVVTNAGAAVTSGYLTAGMSVLLTDDGTNYRLFSYGDASAVQAAAEAAQAAAEAAAAGVNMPSIQSGDAGKQLYVKPDESGYELLAASSGVEQPANVVEFKALDTTETTLCYFNNSLWQFKLGDYSVEVADDTLNALYVKADAIASTSGAWVRIRNTELDASWFGFSPTATASDNTTYINAAITLANDLGGGIIRIGEGTFPVNTILMKASVTLQGINRATSILEDSRSDSNPVITSSDNSASMLWSKVLDLRIAKPNATGGAVVDMTSWQWCEVGRCWITSKSILGTECIRMRGLYTSGPIFTTEGTYNHVHSNYMGLCAFGVRMGPNANTCWIIHNRVQPSVTGGSGFYIGTTGAGETAVSLYPNQVIISENSVEFPAGAGVTGLKGVYVEAVCDDVFITGNRFEGGALSYGVQAISGAKGYVAENHYSGIATSNVTGLSSTFVSVDANEGPMAVIAAKMCIFGTTGAKKGTAHNLTASRSGAGTYVFTFSNAMTDANYSIGTSFVASTAGLTSRVSTKSGASFTIVTETHLGVATDVLDVSVIVTP